MTDLELKLKNELNPEQFDAAMHMEDPALIIAGAGSGKTHTLISRIMHLVDSGVDPTRIVMLTFTNSAADEMKDRASKVNEKCKHVIATTYHKYCSLILRKFGSKIGLSPNFETLTPMKYKTLIEYVKSSSDKYDSLPNFPSSSKLDTIFSQSVNMEIPISDLIKKTCFEQYSSEIYDLYGEIKDYGIENLQLNFDDLLVYMNMLLDDNDICEHVANTFDYLMVDEFQDTNGLQMKILKKLGKYNQNIVVVGDVSQSIYKFRGAKVTNIDDFSSIFNPKVYTLAINYRSTQQILDATNNIMNNHASWNFVDMVSDNKTGNVPQIKYHNNSQEQADWIIETIMNNDLPLSEMAIIERKSMSSFKLENELTKAKIPFEKRGGLKFMEYQCIDEILSFFSVVANKTNKFEWFNILRLIPGIGNKAATDISNIINEQDFMTKLTKKKYYNDLVELFNKIDDWKQYTSISELFDKVVPYYFELRQYKLDQSKKMSSSSKFDAKEKIKRDQKIIDILRDMSTSYNSITEFLEDIALDTVKGQEVTGDRLVITTIHSAKGLEWKMVFLLDCVNYEMDDVDEELRCWYVAMTRAEDNLVISVPLTIMQNGHPTFQKINDLIDDSKAYFEEEYLI